MTTSPINFINGTALNHPKYSARLQLAYLSDSTVEEGLKDCPKPEQRICARNTTAEDNGKLISNY